MLTVSQRLERIRNRRTSYELAAVHPNGSRVLIAYCNPRSNRMMRRAIRARADEMLTLTGDKWLHVQAPMVVTSGEWRIGFTGRTRYQAIVEGELPFLPDYLASAALEMTRGIPHPINPPAEDEDDDADRRFALACQRADSGQ